MTYNATEDALSEYRNLLASGQLEKATQLAEALLKKLHKDGDLDKVKEIVNNIIATAQGNRDISFACLHLGDVLYRENLYDRARACYLQGLNLEVDDLIQKAKLLFGAGNTYFMEGDYLTARDYYHNSLKICQEQNFIPGIAENMAQLSDIARTLGEYKEAEMLGRSSLEFNVKLQREKAIMRSTQSLCNLSVQWEAMGEVTKAKDLLQFCQSILQFQENKGAVELVRLTLSRIKD
jgi:tetratricopeptide (TPR) repeat protein